MRPQTGYAQSPSPQSILCNKYGNTSAPDTIFATLLFKDRQLILILILADIVMRESSSSHA